MNTNGPSVGGDSALDRLNMVIGSLRNFADVADSCVITEVVNSIPAMRTWADELSDIRQSLTSRQGAGAVAVAWRVANHPEGPFALRNTKPSGWTVIEPLYTHPAKSEAGAVVTNEMVERFCASFFLDGSGSDSTLRDLVRDALVAALEGKAND